MIYPQVSFEKHKYTADEARRKINKIKTHTDCPFGWPSSNKRRQINTYFFTSHSLLSINFRKNFCDLRVSLSMPDQIILQI